MMGTVTVIADVANAHYGGEDVPETVAHPETGETIATIGWHNSGGYRGWYEATPVDGWEKVGEGTNCGAWEDTPPGTSNDEVETYINGLAEKHGEAVVVICGSSNVFSTAFDVLARVNHSPSSGQHDLEAPTYKIVRFYSDDRPRKVVKNGLTLDEAQAWCQDEATHGDGWFDGYEEA